MTGTLSLVATPIGNLGDITLRAVECLRNADRIYAEDTRRTRTLLTHLGIEGKKLLSLHAHSSERAVQSAAESLGAGENLALVTDAGMPGVSDPGVELVQAARSVGANVTVLPGASAVTAAVALSGLVDGPFAFYGFLARKGSKRTRALGAIAASALPVVLFESPHRVHETLQDLLEICGGERQIAICRELTKKYEETLVLSLAEVAAPGFREVWQGEFTLVLQKSPHPGLEAQAPLDLDARALEMLSAGDSVKDVAGALAKELSLRGEKTSRREVYGRVLELSSEKSE